ncbi:unnamed protein product [Brassica rapa subsp. narinosa]
MILQSPRFIVQHGRRISTLILQFLGGSSSEMKIWECRLLYCVPLC